MQTRAQQRHWATANLHPVPRPALPRELNPRIDVADPTVSALAASDCCPLWRGTQATAPSS
eukprot:4319811-Pyramimonas_sp.AAC.1